MKWARQLKTEAPLYELDGRHVRRRPLEVIQLIRRQPQQRSVLGRGRRTVEQVAEVRRQGDDPEVVLVRRGDHLRSHADAAAELLQDLAFQCVGCGLAGLDLAAGELPQVASL